MGTHIKQKMTIDGAGKTVAIDGMDFTADGCLEIRNAKSVTVRNCRVFGINTPNARNYWLRIDNDIPAAVRIEHCYFGKNPAKMYNLLEMSAELSDGSLFSNNYFAAGCCAHNTINIYGAGEGADIRVDGNVFEESAGTIRIGVKKAPSCRIEISGNKVEANKPDEGAMWQGLCCIQPYRKLTETFANMTIALDGNVVPCEQIIYAYSGEGDTLLDDGNMPTVTIDGKPAKVTIYH